MVACITFSSRSSKCSIAQCRSFYTIINLEDSFVVFPEELLEPGTSPLEISKAEKVVTFIASSIWTRDQEPGPGKEQGQVLSPASVCAPKFQKP